MSVNTTLGIISTLVHPPVDLLHLEAIPGNPHSGSVSPQRIRGVRNVDAHGIFWNVQSAPAGYGLTVDNVGNHYDRPIIAFREYEVLLDATLLTTAVFESVEAQGYYLFVGLTPQAVNVQIPPGVTINLSWLVFF